MQTILSALRWLEAKLVSIFAGPKPPPPKAPPRKSGPPPTGPR